MKTTSIREEVNDRACEVTQEAIRWLAERPSMTSRAAMVSTYWGFPDRPGVRLNIPRREDLFLLAEMLPELAREDRDEFIVFRGIVDEVEVSLWGQ